MLDKDSEDSLNEAFVFARERRHEYLTVEHLLYALLGNPAANEALSACGANFSVMREEVARFLEKSTQKKKDSTKDTQPTMALQRVLQRAVFQVQSVGKKIVTGAHLLIAIFSEQDSQAVFFLKKQKITRLDVVNYVAHGIVKNSDFDQDGSFPIIDDDDEDREDIEIFDIPETRKKSTLNQFAENLNEKVKKRGDIFIGRDQEIDRLIQILGRRSKNNPLLVGEPGVGKTAIVEGLAKRLVEGNVPEQLKKLQIYSLDLPGLVAGTRYRGDFEQRLKNIMKELAKKPNIVIFIDEIHMLITAGSASGSMGAADMLKPMLSRGEIKCIGATTYKEYRQIFEKEGATARRFQKIDVKEPTVEETYEMLKGLKAIYEKHHQVKYALSALKSAAELSDRFLPDRFLPDKAIDLVDEAGSQVKLLPKELRPEEITNIEIENVIAQFARIPAKNISISDKETIRNLDQNLKMLVFGQNEAIDILVSSIKLARSGLREPNKPWGSFLLAGPTGVGKTEVSQQMASLLAVELIRFDMSEYMESHSVARLIGSPPGYVGYEQGGLLTEAVSKHPYSIVLLDEIEKAHPDLFNILLQVMDNGFLTDTAGRKVDFRNTILILTTNAGAFEGSRNIIGFVDQETQSDSMAALHRLFTPEFRNRLDAIIQFKPLTKEIILKVIEKFMSQLQGQLDQKGVTLEVTEAVKDWLAEKGYDPKMGARPMARIIQEKIKKPLSEEILFGVLSEGGGTVQIDMDTAKEKPQFVYMKP